MLTNIINQIQQSREQDRNLSKQIGTNNPTNQDLILSSSKLLEIKKKIPYGFSADFFNKCSGKNLSDLHIGAEAINEGGHVTSDYFSLICSMFYYNIISKETNTNNAISYKALFDSGNGEANSERYYITDINSIGKTVVGNKRQRSNTQQIPNNTNNYKTKQEMVQTVLRHRLPFQNSMNQNIIKPS